MSKKRSKKLSILDLIKKIDEWQPKKINILVAGEQRVDYKKFVPFQGDLKTIDDIELLKLCLLILKIGFFKPIEVWGGKIIDGHHRLKAIEFLADKGFAIPLIPVNIVIAGSEEKAREMVLASSSTYAKFKKESLNNWIDSLTDDVTKLFNLGDMENIKIDIDDLQDENKELKERYDLIIDCENEETLHMLYDRMIEEGYKCRISTL